MTIPGAIVERERAVIWCDTEVHRGDRPSCLRPKLIVSPGAGAVMASMGRTCVTHAARRPFLESIELDEMPAAMMRALRAEGAKRADRLQRMERGSFASNLVLAVGWSAPSHRMLAYELSGASFFVPTLTTRCCYPLTDEFDTCRSERIADVLTVARAQMRALRTWWPDATGGALTVAELLRGQIVTRTFANQDWAHECAEEIEDARAEPAERQPAALELCG